MRTIPAQEIKRRGISAVDDLVREGPVHVIQHNHPRYVILTEEQYRELLDAQEAAAVARIKTALAEVQTGNVRQFESTADLMAALEQTDDER